MRSLLCVLGLLATGACFTDSKPMTQACPAGAAGCACRDDDACDMGLECREPGVCVEPSCAPGTQGCLCDGQTCMQGLICNELGACVKPDSATDTAAMSGSGSATSTSSTTTDASTGDPPTTGPSDATDGSNPCLQCLSGAAGDCAGLCSGECSPLVQCLNECVGGGEPVGMCGDCCDGVDVTTRPFLMCLADQCSEVCNIPDACKGAG